MSVLCAVHGHAGLHWPPCVHAWLPLGSPTPDRRRGGRQAEAIGRLGRLVRLLRASATLGDGSTAQIIGRARGRLAVTLRALRLLRPTITPRAASTAVRSPGRSTLGLGRQELRSQVRGRLPPARQPGLGRLRRRGAAFDGAGAELLRRAPTAVRRGTAKERRPGPRSERVVAPQRGRALDRTSASFGPSDLAKAGKRASGLRGTIAPAGLACMHGHP